MVCEYCNGGDVEGLIEKKKSLPESEVIKIMKALVEGNAYLNEHGIIHRDIKPANMMIHDGAYKIADYGLSKVVGEDGLAKSLNGSPVYQAPEITNAKTPYSALVDTFSIGIMLWECLYGNPGPWWNSKSVPHLNQR